MNRLFILKFSSPLILFFLVIWSAPSHAYFDNYASIAYSMSTGLWGTSYRQPSRFAADNQALRNCYAGDCQVLVWVRNSCAALAVGRSGYNVPPVYGWAYDRSVLYAERLAMNHCFTRTSYGCGVVASVCSE